MMCEHKCIKFCIMTKGFYYFDSNSHRRRGLIGPTDSLYEKSEMLLHASMFLLLVLKYINEKLTKNPVKLNSHRATS